MKQSADETGRRALDRTRRLIEAGAVREARPAKLRQQHKARKVAKRRPKRKQPPIPPRDLPAAVARLNSHFQGGGIAEPNHRTRRKPNKERTRKRELRQMNEQPIAEWVASARQHLADNKPPGGLRRDVADRLCNQARNSARRGTGPPKR